MGAGPSRRRSSTLLRVVLGLFAVAALFTPVVARAEMASVKVAEANFRAGPSTDERVRFIGLRYFPVKVLKREGTWTYVRDFEGEKAWIASRLLSNQLTVISKAKRGNVRAEPTSKSEIVYRMSRGWAFRVLERKKSWIRIGDESSPIGWVHQKLVWGLEKKKPNEKK
ncbi:MAG: SH3 domain-containing protein [Deltaproteobacteria bacterium]|jgi:SH3-like domain-containing protein|nr:SH3 domain-containing protein [Deltaproteobacteria bacterium]MBW2535522.1 SH3 domain-containing protein [Deltaproteobacteria bacterium]